MGHFGPVHTQGLTTITIDPLIFLILGRTKTDLIKIYGTTLIKKKTALKFVLICDERFRFKLDLLVTLKITHHYKSTIITTPIIIIIIMIIVIIIINLES